jgi:ABC-2 type transport system permease protein
VDRTKTICFAIVGLFAAQGNIMMYLSDPFEQYPLYAKAMVWADPMSHGMVSAILGGNGNAVIAGMPLWANALFLVAYAMFLLAAAVALFQAQDIT